MNALVDYYLTLIERINTAPDEESVEHLESAADHAWKRMTREQRAECKARLKNND